MAYLDHAATTPMRPAAVLAMTEALTVVGNASSLHASGRRARRRVEECRERLATALGARPSEIIFTAGGTESDNLAIKGIYWARRDADQRRRRILVAPTEHHAVLDAVQWLADHEGAELDWLAVDSTGRVAPETLRAAIEAAPETVALVTVMWANNEVGTINPMDALVAVASEHDIPLHSDAVQAVGMLPVDFGASGISALSLAGHKVGGPIGVGALLLRRDVACVPLLHGGGQERDVRSGTLDAPAVAALSAAVEESVGQRAPTARRVEGLRDELIAQVLAQVPDAVVNGAAGERLRTGSEQPALPGIAHFTFPGCEGDALLMLLDAKGIECSTGSACTAGVAEASHVLIAMGADRSAARGSLRFSLGHDSTPEDVRELGAVIGSVVERARAAGVTRRRTASTDDGRSDPSGNTGGPANADLSGRPTETGARKSSGATAGPRNSMDTTDSTRTVSAEV
ncbi:cysteine desulfurase family protein [Actinoalloteichus hymeniacidonis]|uniref:Cysteine desulfurase family protein n=1 Tax=Actinoalloteichus hymeniacidonis TaxID=340345 RepID=A0AAC9MXT4_9PSEU|nr:cysteine desulfurase family protein [Actinoalloteichus hymeniacidonis]AOS62161.1 cysteine desulfurase family protein [Actinoalloteichus hymeniacidonis]MBB5909816.1 cysteine desulfurase [Actinoalloteichus hymeniacidonis]